MRIVCSWCQHMYPNRSHKQCHLHDIGIDNVISALQVTMDTSCSCVASWTTYLAVLWTLFKLTPASADDHDRASPDSDSASSSQAQLFIALIITMFLLFIVLLIQSHLSASSRPAGDVRASALARALSLANAETCRLSHPDVACGFEHVPVQGLPEEQ